MNTLDSKTLRQARVAQVSLIVMAIPWALLYFVLPLAASEIGREMDVPHLIVPFAIASCLTVLAVHVFMFAVWKVVTFIRSGNFYAMPVQRWVKVARGAVLVGCLMPIAVGFYLLIGENAGGPLMAPFIFGVVTVAVAASALLDLLVGLYRDASSNVAELAEVI